MSDLVLRVRAGARSDFVRSGFLVFLALVLASVLYYGVYLVLGHTLTVAAYGTVMSLVSVSLLAATPAAIGQTIVAKMVAQRAASDKPLISRAIAFRTSAASALAAAAIVISGVVWQARIAQYFHLENDEYVVLTAVATALCVLLFLGRGLLQGARLFKAFAVSNVLDGVLRVVLTLFLAVRWGVNGALLAMVVSLSVAVAYGAFVSARALAPVADVVAPANLPSGAVATGTISFALIALSYYDPILVKHYLPAADAGVYGVLSLAGRTVAIALSFVPIVLLPHVTQRTTVGSSSRTLLGAALVLSAAISAGATLAAVFGAPLVVAVLSGPAFRAAIPLLAMYVAAASCLAVANVLAAYLIGKHDYRALAALSAVALAEVAAVVVRHSTLLAVVQDILAGHAAVVSIMLAGTLVQLAGSGDRRRIKAPA
jgi:O-antigen/teichoic acid export membrane protein